MPTPSPSGTSPLTFVLELTLNTLSTCSVAFVNPPNPMTSKATKDGSKRVLVRMISAVLGPIVALEPTGESRANKVGAFSSELTVEFEAMVPFHQIPTSTPFMKYESNFPSTASFTPLLMPSPNTYGNTTLSKTPLNPGAVPSMVVTLPVVVGYENETDPRAPWVNDKKV
ncbi:hypothetical protein SERLADRAFT_477463, partial [Serpula lacrymans var. lacrymans S7.9]